MKYFCVGAAFGLAFSPFYGPAWGFMAAALFLSLIEPSKESK